MSLRVLHIVSPRFGHNFSGRSRYEMSLMRRWKVQGISLSDWGTDYDIFANSRPRSNGEVRDEESGLWQKSLRLRRPQRALWALRLLTQLSVRRNE